jgi:hypothetical protein
MSIRPSMRQFRPVTILVGVSTAGKSTMLEDARMIGARAGEFEDSIQDEAVMPLFALHPWNRPVSDDANWLKWRAFEVTTVAALIGSFDVVACHTDTFRGHQPFPVPLWLPMLRQHVATVIWLDPVPGRNLERDASLQEYIRTAPLAKPDVVKITAEIGATFLDPGLDQAKRFIALQRAFKQGRPS